MRPNDVSRADRSHRLHARPAEQGPAATSIDEASLDGAVSGAPRNYLCVTTRRLVSKGRVFLKLTIMLIFTRLAHPPLLMFSQGENYRVESRPVFKNLRFKACRSSQQKQENTIYASVGWNEDI